LRNAVTTRVLVAWGIAVALIAALIIFDIWLVRFRRREKLDNDKKSSKTYFEELSQTEQKVFLSEETYRREVFGIRILSDKQFEKLRLAKCSRIADVNEAYCYNPTACPNGQAKMKYLNPRSRYEDETANKDDLVTPTLFGHYLVKKGDLNTALDSGEITTDTQDDNFKKPNSLA